jgi:serine/threonine protein kinase
VANQLEPEAQPESLLTRRLSLPDHDPLPEELSTVERQRLAQERVNSQLKGWRLVRLLGVGPVAAAYEAVRGAKDARERAVLRLMVGKLGQHERARSLFLRGAYAANRFQHARVLPVSEDGTDETGAPWVVRAWADAEPLADVVGRATTFREAEVLRIGEQILDALEMAHAHAIVHGALSLSNVLLTERRSIRLCDFATPPGLGARQAAEEDALARARISPFSAPERCAEPPQPPTEQGDVFSVAAILYTLLAGVPPRGDAKTPADLARAPCVPLRERVPSASESVAAVLDHALAFEPLHRYESAYAMLGDVRRVMAGRKPKLGDAQGPTPSTMDVSANLPPSSRRLLAIGRAESAFSLPPSTNTPRPDEWKGNVLLILAIALLVGVATFVMVRERVEEERRNQNGDVSGQSAEERGDDETSRRRSDDEGGR